MFELDKNNCLIFKAEDLKEVYEPIITQFGFEYDAGLDRNKKGMVWSKCYVADAYNVDLWPVMIIRESGNDMCPTLDAATYFSTSLYWDDFYTNGFTLHVNPNEFDDGSGDEVQTIIDYILAAQKEVNDILECCRQQLASTLTDIRNKLIVESNKEAMI